MGKVTGFLEYDRITPRRRAVGERVCDYREIELPVVDEELRKQGARCMDCGIPFCNTGCPLANLIPDWNDAVFRGDFAEASVSLHATNNFPEFTGHVCPAPCEEACVLNIDFNPVSIKLLERSIAERAIAEGWIRPQPAAHATEKRVAVVGSGPAGLAAAQQLARAGHGVTVFERDERPGGLLALGIPDFKLDKSLLRRRVEQLTAEGVRFRTGVEVGVDLPAAELRERYDAVVLCGGSRVPRDLPIEGRSLAGVHFAMDFLTQQNRRVAGSAVPDELAIVATGKGVVVIGGGDTGSDCIGTSLRQGARSVTSLEILPRPPTDPRGSWPLWPSKLRTSTSHEEGGEREWSVSAERFLGDQAGRLRAVQCVRVEHRAGRFERVAGTEFELAAELALLAMGFVHPERAGLLEQLGVALTERGNVWVDERMMTSVPGVFAAGDIQRGQSLVVWAIADGRRAAQAVDTYLMSSSELSTPGRAGILR